MKIQTGFITNSSSTNFLIISKEELTEDFLFKKLGFIEGSPLEKQARELCREIIYQCGDSIYDKALDYNSILEFFDQKAASYYEKHPDFHVYTGSTGTDNDEDSIITYFTLSSFEIEEKDFFLNGKECFF